MRPGRLLALILLPFLLLFSSPLRAAEWSPRPLAEIAVYPEYRAPATVVAQEEARIAAELSARVVETDEFAPPPDGGADARGHVDYARRQLGGNARLLLRHHGGRRSKLGVYGDLGKWPWRPLRRA